MGRINHLRDCDHDATRAANRKCRAAKLARVKVTQDRVSALLAGAADMSGWLGEGRGEAYLSRAAYRLGLADDPKCGHIYAACQLATWRADMGGGRFSDGVAWSEVMHMFS